MVDRHMLLTGSPETADKLHLEQLTQQYTDRYMGRCADNYIYGRRLENTDLWFFMTVDFNFWSIMNIPQALLLLAVLGSVIRGGQTSCFYASGICLSAKAADADNESYPKG